MYKGLDAQNKIELLRIVKDKLGIKREWDREYREVCLELANTLREERQLTLNPDTYIELLHEEIGLRNHLNSNRGFVSTCTTSGTGITATNTTTY